MMSDIEEKQKRMQQKIRQGKVRQSQNKIVKYILITLRKKRSKQHEEQEGQSLTSTLIVYVDNEETKFPFRFTPGTRSWRLFIDDQKKLCEVSQWQRVSLTYKQKVGENCFKSHLKEKSTKHLKSMSGVIQTRSHSWSM